MKMNLWRLKMTKIELNDFETEALIELIADINKNNDEPTFIRFWNSIVRKLDPDGKFRTEHLLDAEEQANQLLEDKKRKGQLNWGSIVYGGEDGAY